jgi:DNA-binding transcriptional MerR regulator
MSGRDRNSCSPYPDLSWIDDTGEHHRTMLQTDVLSLAAVAKMFGVSPLLLRCLEFRGIIRRRLRVGRTRVYSWADCERIAVIVKCRSAGLPLRRIVPILEAASRATAASRLVTARENCMTLFNRLERQRKVLDSALAELDHIQEVLNSKLSQIADSDGQED